MQIPLLYKGAGSPDCRYHVFQDSAILEWRFHRFYKNSDILPADTFVFTMTLASLQVPFFYHESGTLECACVCFTKILPPLGADCVFFARILRFRMQIIVFRRILVFLIADTVVFATGPIRCPCGKRPPAPQPQPLTVNDAGFGACCRSRSQAAVHPWRFRPDLGNVIKI